MKKMPLPSPHSPQKLDEKILGYAQQNAPTKKKSFRNPLWISGLATASVIGLAVLITVPKNTGFTPQADTTTISADMEEAAHDEASQILSKSAPFSTKRLKRETRPAKKPSSHGLALESARPREMAEMSLGIAADTELAEQFTTESLKEYLPQLSRLIDAGKTTEAAAVYDKLKRQCYNCDLPDTLAGALEKYPGTSAPPTP